MTETCNSRFPGIMRSVAAAFIALVLAACDFTGLPADRSELVGRSGSGRSDSGASDGGASEAGASDAGTWDLVDGGTQDGGPAAMGDAGSSTGGGADACAPTFVGVFNCSGVTKPSVATPESLDCTTSGPSSDDGAAAAASLASCSLDCSFSERNCANVNRAWAEARDYCTSIGYRLPTKGEVLRIRQEPSLCRTSLPQSWGTWSSTCGGSSKAWLWSYLGYDLTPPTADGMFGVLCVR